jgi:hypothetical protein
MPLRHCRFHQRTDDNVWKDEQRENGRALRTRPVPFAPGASSRSGDQLDKAGRSILNLLHKAAGAAEQNSQHALDIAQQLSDQLRAAEQRVADLEAEAERHRDRAERAEQWLHKVYSEIEERFLRQARARTTAP